jgi:hypothetical protein
VRGTGTRFARTLRDHPSALLLGAQLIAVLAYPFLADSTAGRAVLGVLQPAIVLIAVYAVRRTPVLAWVAVVFGLPAIVFSVLEAIRPEDDLVVVGSALVHVPFYFFVSYAMIRYLFADERVTRDELFATGAAFTVVAWGFAYLYAAGDPGDRSWFDLLFLSFTTLTSVGLSDVLPVLPHARSLVMVEQVAGVLYVALVVARLVGLTVVGRSGR